MGKHSKLRKFIDKKDPNTHSFQVVHRSQRDPLAADEHASQFVLMSTDGAPMRDASLPPPQPDEQAELGVFFGDADDYDYTQHLRERGQANSELLMADPLAVQKARRLPKNVLLGLPDEALPSAHEMDIGLLNLAAPVTGPRLDWDPDVIEALDDGLDLDDPENLLEDDFVMAAMMEESSAGAPPAARGHHRAHHDDGDDDDDASSYDDDDDDDVDSFGNGGEDDAFDVSNQDAVRGFARALAGGDEVKSRFTEYSMTSSILPRSELQQTHDDRFEKLFEDYDNDNIGALNEEGEHIGGLRDLSAFGGVLDAHMAKHTNLRGSYMDDKQDVARDKRIAGDFVARQEAIERAGGIDTEMIAMDPKPEKQWDCQSILSTRSTLYNHPTKLSERTRITLDKRGLPVNVLQEHAHRRKAGKAALPETSAAAAAAAIAAAAASAATTHRTADPAAADAPHERESGGEDGSDGSGTVGDTRENKGVPRNRAETPAERKARKQAIKEERRTRRTDKKATKTAFKAEEQRQGAQMFSVGLMPSGMKL